MQERILSYQRELSELGIRDYQVSLLGPEKEVLDGDAALREMRIPYRLMYLMMALVLALIPAVLLNIPVGLVSGIYSERRRKKALANSKVKIQGLDVMLSERVALCIVLVPALWFLYGLLLVLCTNLDGPSVALSILCMPLFSYMGIMVTEAGMVQIKDLRPHFIAIFPSFRRRLTALPHVRKELQHDLRELIKKIGPMLGEVYFEKDLDWGSIRRKSRMSLAEVSILKLASEEVKKML